MLVLSHSHKKIENTFSKSKVTNLRGPSNSLLFFKKNWRGPSASFQKNWGGGGRAPPAPMDGTPMSTEYSIYFICSALTVCLYHNYKTQVKIKQTLKNTSIQV